MGRERKDYRSNITMISDMFPGSGMLTVAEVASFLKCDRHTVTAMIDNGKLPAVNISTGKKGNARDRVSVEALARVCS